jgi:hypothetical protein
LTDGPRLAMVVPAWLETGCSVGIGNDGGWRWLGPDLDTVAEPEQLDKA